MIQRHLKYSEAEREWINQHAAEMTGKAAWKPAKGTELSADAVNGMLPDAQWGYKADVSTRGALPKGYGKTVKQPVKRQTVQQRAEKDRSVLVAELRARIAELESALRIATIQDDHLPVIRERWAA